MKVTKLQKLEISIKVFLIEIWEWLQTQKLFMKKFLTPLERRIHWLVRGIKPEDFIFGAQFPPWEKFQAIIAGLEVFKIPEKTRWIKIVIEDPKTQIQHFYCMDYKKWREWAISESREVRLYDKKVRKGGQSWDAVGRFHAKCPHCQNVFTPLTAHDRWEIPRDGEKFETHVDFVVIDLWGCGKCEHKFLLINDAESGDWIPWVNNGCTIPLTSEDIEELREWVFVAFNRDMNMSQNQFLKIWRTPWDRASEKRKAKGEEL